MATKKQIKANRSNAQKSTGPKTEAGKAASSRNALCHGLTATHAIVLPDENADAFDSLQREVLGDLDPQGALQAALAERIVVLLWRLDRAARLECQLFIHGQRRADRRKVSTALSRGASQDRLRKYYCRGEQADAAAEAVDLMFRAEREIDLEIRTKAPWAEVLAERKQSARLFDRVERHEASLQRALHRTLEEFRRLRVVSPVKPESSAPPPIMPEPAPGAASDPEPAPSRAVRQPARQGQRPLARRPQAEVGSGREKAFLQNEANSAQRVEETLDSGPDANPPAAPPVT